MTTDELFREFCRLVPYPFEGGYDAESLKGPEHMPFDVGIFKQRWDLPTKSGRGSIDNFYVEVLHPKAHPSASPALCRVAVLPYGNQPEVLLTYHTGGVTAVLTPNLRWVKYETARGGDTWSLVTRNHKHLVKQAQRMHTTIQRCLLDRFRGLAGTDPECDSCPNQLTCVGLNVTLIGV